MCTYKNLFSENVHQYCKKHNDIEFVFLKTIENFNKCNFYSNKVKTVSVINVNTHRLVLSMKNTIDYIDRDTDVVIRLRIDTELHKFVIDDIDCNTYYATPQAGGISDNIGYSDYKTFLSIWNIPNTFVEEKLGINNECILNKWCIQNKIKVKNFEYKFKLYQSSDKNFDGVPQWSKRDRIFQYSK